MHDFTFLLSEGARLGKCPLCEASVVRSDHSRCGRCQKCNTVLWVPSRQSPNEQISAVHKCPECRADVVRQDFDRYGFCRGECNIMLLIPPWRNPERPITAVCCQVGDNSPEKITREHFELFSRATLTAASQ